MRLGQIVARRAWRIIRHPVVRVPSSLAVAVVIVSAVAAANIPNWAAQETTNQLTCAPFCQEGSGSTQGGQPLPTPRPTPTPPPRIWVSLPGLSGPMFNWGGTPDHHDVLDEHAVDIDAIGCTSTTNCPSVYFYDRSGSVTTNATWSPYSCARPTGGESVKVALTSVSPAGVLQGYAIYRHLINATTAASLTDGGYVGQVNPNVFSCSTGPHVHQGVNSVPAANLQEFTGINANCPPDVAANITMPCYSVSW